jgi:hypothetical protein
VLRPGVDSPLIDMSVIVIMAQTQVASRHVAVKRATEQKKIFLKQPASQMHR